MADATAPPAASAVQAAAKKEESGSTDVADQQQQQQQQQQQAHTSNDDPASDTESVWTEEEEINALRQGYNKNMSTHSATSKSRLNRALKSKKDGRAKVSDHHFTSLTRMRSDGRVNISVNETGRTGYLAKALGSAMERQTFTDAKQGERDAERERNRLLQEKGEFQVPPMNIVVMVIGSRGDITPFVKIGQILQNKYHHRVRIATHPKFRTFIQDDAGLEFFSVGGDPSALMAYMVKNPGLMPSMETIKAGEISRRRDDMYLMMTGFWRSCINATDGEEDAANLKYLADKPPFIADAIIANPPSFAHYHCAEKLGCPLHLVFTFPYTPTQVFPHPLANIKNSNVDPNYTNYMSYPLVDLLTWQGLGDLVNKFRTLSLGLEPVSSLWAPGQFTRMRVPTTYMWSPSLVPKPFDWGPEVDVVGYVFLDLASTYTPPDDMAEFLRRDGPDQRPIFYIGFGSISGIEDPDGFARMIFDAVGKANVRAIVSRGWGGMGDGMDKPDGVFMVDSVPHDWLFPRIDAVVHHGGAGTTANGLKFGKPTMIVPFFGDQPFWSAMICKAGAGAKESLPLKKLNADKFAKGMKECLTPEAKAKAQEIAAAIAKEGDGAENVVDSFHRSLPLEDPRSMRCSIFPERVSVWHVKHVDISADLRLSTLAATMLVESHQLQWSDLTLLPHRKWYDFQGPGEPITGAGGALLSSFAEAFQGIEGISENTKRDMKVHEEEKKRKNEMPTNESELQKREIRRLNSQMNLSGEAEPFRTPYVKSRQRRKNGANASAGDSAGAVIVAKDVGKGVGQTAKAIVCIPADLLYAITLGFRNAPRLYGDQTVRPLTHPITGFGRGVKTAGSEFVHGVYDGVTGLVTLPVRGVREGGAVELPKGVARGVGALVLKPLAGTLGLIAYPSHGALQSLHSWIRDTGKTRRWITHARISQGIKDLDSLRAQQGQVSPAAGQPLPAHGNDLAQMRKIAIATWKSRRDYDPKAHQKIADAAAKVSR